MATSGDNVYVVWWTNKTGNNEVMFRASTDNGATFGNKTNLSNSKGAESVDVQIAASGDNVYVSWWERNQTADQPVMRVSDDNGNSFGAVVNLGANGTISSGSSGG
jgi:lysophospholipase L1-like esterase